GHAMMMVQYLLDQDAGPIVPGIAAPQTDFDDIAAPVSLALKQEKTVTDQINAMAAVARQESDFAGEQFIQWFIKEQVEEVSSMSDLLTVVERLIDSPMQIEDHLAREMAASVGGTVDPTAPAQAGGASA
ncbi:MAG: ferritin, partial [Actinobacteria bacterium]|nr:ferritin [Actinomycetota bacterium]